MPKPQASCTITVAPGMVVNTQATSKVADKAQQGIMEFLLINHPLDCPVCDKGGECPLQNQAMSNGRGETRFDVKKRTYPKPINISAQVLLDRERCVLCARCTRFSEQIAGDPFIALIERGALQQVGIYEKQPFESDDRRPDRTDRTPAGPPHLLRLTRRSTGVLLRVRQDLIDVGLVRHGRGWCAPAAAAHVVAVGQLRATAPRRPCSPARRAAGRWRTRSRRCAPRRPSNRRRQSRRADAPTALRPRCQRVAGPSLVSPEATPGSPHDPTAPGVSRSFRPPLLGRPLGGRGAHTHRAGPDWPRAATSRCRRSENGH